MVDIEKLNNPTMMSAFQALLATLVDEDADLGSMGTQFNKAVLRGESEGAKTIELLKER